VVAHLSSPPEMVSCARHWDIVCRSSVKHFTQVLILWQKPLRFDGGAAHGGVLCCDLAAGLSLSGGPCCWEPLVPPEAAWGLSHWRPSDPEIALCAMLRTSSQSYFTGRDWRWEPLAALRIPARGSSYACLGLGF